MPRLVKPDAEYDGAQHAPSMSESLSARQSPASAGVIQPELALSNFAAGTSFPCFLQASRCGIRSPRSLPLTPGPLVLGIAFIVVKVRTRNSAGGGGVVIRRMLERTGLRCWVQPDSHCSRQLSERRIYGHELPSACCASHIPIKLIAPAYTPPCVVAL